jgi:hypothetical protein
MISSNRKIERIFKLIHEFLGSEEALLYWLETPSEKYKGLTPSEMIEMRNIDIVYADVIKLLGTDKEIKKLRGTKK